MATSYVSVFLPAVQQLALAPLLGPYPQAYTASQLRSLRRAPADLITGRITSSLNPSGLCLYRRGLWHDLAGDFPCGVTDFFNGGADFPYGGADCRAANREFSAAIRQSGPKTTKRTTRSRPAKTVRMAAVHYVAPFAWVGVGLGLGWVGLVSVFFLFCLFVCSFVRLFVCSLFVVRCCLFVVRLCCLFSFVRVAKLMGVVQVIMGSYSLLHRIFLRGFYQTPKGKYASEPRSCMRNGMRLCCDGPSGNWRSVVMRRERVGSSLAKSFSVTGGTTVIEKGFNQTGRGPASPLLRCAHRAPLFGAI